MLEKVKDGLWIHFEPKAKHVKKRIKRFKEALKQSQEDAMMYISRARGEQNNLES